jgi:hypothetical protein
LCNHWKETDVNGYSSRVICQECGQKDIQTEELTNEWAKRHAGRQACIQSVSNVVRKIYRQTEELTNKWAKRQTDRQACIQSVCDVVRQIHRQADKPTNKWKKSILRLCNPSKETDRQADSFVYSHSVRQAGLYTVSQ